MTETQSLIATLDVEVIGQIYAVSKSFMTPKVGFDASTTVVCHSLRRWTRSETRRAIYNIAAAQAPEVIYFFLMIKT